MKIGMLTDTYKPQTDGVVTSIGIFQKELERLGHEVLVFAPRYPGQPQDPPGVYRFENFAFPPYPEYKVVYPVSKNLALKEIPKLGLDLLHVQTPLGMGFFGIYLAKKFKIPSIFTYHTFFDQYVHYLPGPKSFHRWLIRRLTRWFCNQFPLVLTPTAPIKKTLSEYGISRPIEVLPTGLDYGNLQNSGVDVRKKFGLSSDATLLSSAGRLGKEKSFDLVLKAFQLIKRTFPKTKLVLMGDGPDREELVALARSLGLEGEVIFTGLLPRPLVMDVFAASDLFVFGSQSETQGMVVLEALAQGTPCVAVDVLGPGYLLENNQGGLLAKPDFKDLADKVKSLLADPALLQAKRQEARRRAEEFSATKMTQKLLGYYAQVLGKSVQPAPAP